MADYSDGEVKGSCGCIVLAIIAIIVSVILRTYVFTPTGWGF
jgi:hypothetical protein